MGNPNSDSGSRQVEDAHVTHSFSTVESRDFDKYLETLGFGENGEFGLEVLGEENMSSNERLGTFDGNEELMLHPEWNAKQQRPRTPPDQSNSGKPTA